ncbi:MAG: Dehydrogenase short-chain alcohol dehydrogenase like protein [Thermomicrobiales bacterium]|nr:Dehydrogenase short-chain alcohol dehydrogenase like protein [Thermomicrobiales bacterium]
MQLKDKIALVTGGTSGIGRAVAELFAEEGAAVTLTGRRRELGQEVVTGIKAKSGQADFVETDVRQLPEVRAVIDETARRLGRLDILVNNAGISLPRTLLATSEEDYTDLFETNVRSMFFATKWAAELMVRQGSGSIVSIASVSGIRGQEERAAYCGTKGAVLQITRAAALELAPLGVRVNAVSPGVVDTPLLRNARFPDAPNQDELVREVGASLPVGRVGLPEDIARAVLYLASDEAGWVTGTNLVIDGGAHAR